MRPARIALVLLALAAGCAPVASAIGPSVDAEPDGGASEDGAQDGATPRCAPGSMWIGTVEGRLVDESGAALSDENIGLCGSTCFGSRTRSDGRFSVHADFCFPTSREYPRGAVFDVYGLGYHPDVSIGIGPRGLVSLDHVMLGDLALPGLFGTPSVPVPGAGDPAQRLELPDSFALTIAPDSLELGFNSIARVSAVRVERERLPPFHDLDEAGVTALYATTPSGARCRVPARVELPNDTGLAAGAEVDIVMAGEPLASDVLPPGSIGVVDKGHVTADGRTIIADHGLPFLGWVGYRVP